jgi:hypothetical protein
VAGLFCGDFGDARGKVGLDDLRLMRVTLSDVPPNKSASGCTKSTKKKEQKNLL